MKNILIADAVAILCTCIVVILGYILGLPAQHVADLLLVISLAVTLLSYVLLLLPIRASASENVFIVGMVAGIPLTAVISGYHASSNVYVAVIFSGLGLGMTALTAVLLSIACATPRGKTLAIHISATVIAWISIVYGPTLFKTLF